MTVCTQHFTKGKKKMNFLFSEEEKNKNKKNNKQKQMGTEMGCQCCTGV